MTSGIHPGAALAVSRVRTTFRDGLGQEKVVTGSGFWLIAGRDEYLITNKHLIDPHLKLGADTQMRLVGVSALLRHAESVDQWTSRTEFGELENAKSFLCHDEADVAVLKNPAYVSMYGHSSFTLEEVATEQFLRDVVLPMDAISFFGYPGTETAPWWDTKWNMAIARTAYVSSIPGLPFTNPAVTTADVVVVNGLSFMGSSGSPVMSHNKHRVVGAPYAPPRLLGIMSGHWWEKDEYPAMFKHSGLSYFTRSTSIRELL